MVRARRLRTGDIIVNGSRVWGDSIRVYTSPSAASVNGLRGSMRFSRTPCVLVSIV
jgi:hypothetical protein